MLLTSIEHKLSCLVLIHEYCPDFCSYRAPKRLKSRPATHHPNKSTLSIMWEPLQSQISSKHNWAYRNPAWPIFDTLHHLVLKGPSQHSCLNTAELRSATGKPPGGG